jgi:hypothetical protein
LDRTKLVDRAHDVAEAGYWPNGREPRP